MKTFDLSEVSVRDLNQMLHDQSVECVEREFEVLNPKGQHNIACGIDQNLSVDIQGHAGYFCAGMNKKAHVTIHGNVGQGVAENMMSGTVRVKGDASPGGRRHGTRRSAGDRGQRRSPLRYLHERGRYRGQGQCGPHELLHGTGRQPGGLR